MVPCPRLHRRALYWAVGVTVVLLLTSTSGVDTFEAGGPRGNSVPSLRTAYAEVTIRPTSLPPCFTETVAGSPECGGAQLVYDATDGYVLAQMICLNTTAVALFDSCTWRYQSGSWTEVTSPNGLQPPALLEDGFVWDAADGYALLFGGTTYPSGHTFDWSWSYRGGVWTNLTSAPDFRFAPASAVYDSTDSEILATYYVIVPGTPNWNFYDFRFQGGAWFNISAASPVPAQLGISALAADDPSDDGALFFGGLSTTGPAVNSTWLFRHGSWNSVRSFANPPPLYSPSLGYDSVDGYVLLVGGTYQACLANPCQFSGSVWTFASGEWTNRTATTRGPIPEEAGGSLVTDLATSSTIEGFGYIGYTGTETNGYATPQPNLYSYAGGAWSVIPSAPSTAALPLAVLVAVVLGAVGATAVGLWGYRSRRRARTPPRSGLSPPT